MYAHSINFKQYEPQPNSEGPSAVMRAILEQENATGGVAGLPEYQEDRRSNFFSDTHFNFFLLHCIKKTSMRHSRKKLDITADLKTLLFCDLCVLFHFPSIFPYQD